MALRLLVVDDVAAMRRLTGRLLTQAGHTVVGAAPDGPAGIVLTLARSPDAVIMDWQMPGLDGVEATRRVLAIRPDAYVIAFSSAHDVRVRDAFISAGAFAYHDKDDRAGLRDSVARVADLVARRSR